MLVFLNRKDTSKYRMDAKEKIKKGTRKRLKNNVLDG